MLKRPQTLLIVPEFTDVPLKERASRINAHCAALGKENVSWSAFAPMPPETAQNG